MRKPLIASLLLGCGPAFAVDYTDWTAATPTARASLGSAQGTIARPNSSSVIVDYQGDVQGPTQVDSTSNLEGGLLQNYWNPSTPYLNSVVTAPPPLIDLIALKGGDFQNVINFSEPVTDPLMLIVSLGSGEPNDPSAIVGTYTFDAPFELLSSGLGYFGSFDGPTLTQNGNELSGVEGHGTIQFKGTYSRIGFTASDEYWSGFTLALPSAVPDSLGFVPTVGALLTCLTAARLRKRVD